MSGARKPRRLDAWRIFRWPLAIGAGRRKRIAIIGSIMNTAYRDRMADSSSIARAFSPSGHRM